MGIYDELEAWATEKLPEWKSDALRRYCLNGRFTPQDYEALLALVKLHHGVAVQGSPATPEAISAEHFPAEAGSNQRITLSALHSLRNVGAIPSDQSLTFQKNGLTIVYGGNGTGKSGYARVLKQACRARSPGIVYPNAYDKNFKALKPSAKIRFELDGTELEADWEHQKPSHPVLRSISVFDSDCARQYLQGKEVSAFQPIALTALQSLASDVSQNLKSKINAEIALLKTDISEFESIGRDTEAGKSIHPITATTNLAKARDLAVLTASEEKEIEELPVQINEANPIGRAELLEHSASRLDEVVESFRAEKDEVSDEKIQEIKNKHKDMVDAEEAERAASKILSGAETAELLIGTGQAAWAALFNAAKEFSLNAAYVDSTFPAVGNDTRCVLCQQELSDEAKDRMLRFNKYINDKASETAQRCRRAWQEEKARIDKLTINIQVSRVMKESLGKRAELLPTYIESAICNISARLTWLKDAVAKGVFDSLPGYSAPGPEEGINEISRSLKSEAMQLRQNVDLEALEKKKLRLRELQARKLLSENINKIEEKIGDLALNERLKKCLDDINSVRPISLFANKLAKKYISESLAGLMNDELEKLELHHIKVGVSSNGDFGSVRLGILLPDANLDPHQVLSEAEQRVCSLAYFMAEQRQSGSTSGIVFDDPVSSLDHSHRSAVARRLVEESAGRQVIILTHDAVFFSELQFFATDAGQSPDMKSISYRAEGPGYIDAGLPIDLRKFKDRVKQHKADHAEITKDFKNPPTDKERIGVRNFYDDLRVTIEVAIEDIVLNGTVGRFQENISVGRLNGVMLVEDREFTEVQRLHDRCCRHVRAHAHARGLQQAVPQPAELLQDLQEIEALFTAINKRKSS